MGTRFLRKRTYVLKFKSLYGNKLFIRSTALVINELWCTNQLVWREFVQIVRNFDEWTGKTSAAKITHTLLKVPVFLVKIWSRRKLNCIFEEFPSNNTIIPIFLFTMDFAASDAQQLMQSTLLQILHFLGLNNDVRVWENSSWSFILQFCIEYLYPHRYIFYGMQYHKVV